MNTLKPVRFVFIFIRFISYRFPWCFRMFPLVFLRFPRVFLLFPLSVSSVSYFRFCGNESRFKKKAFMIKKGYYSFFVTFPVNNYFARAKISVEQEHARV